jgi:hypothetical protein
MEHCWRLARPQSAAVFLQLAHDLGAMLLMMMYASTSGDLWKVDKQNDKCRTNLEQTPQK